MPNLNCKLFCSATTLFKVLTFAIFLFISIPGLAQKRFTISGTVKDAATGEVLIGATIQLKQIPQSGTVSNSYGFYSISAVGSEYDLLVTYTGYEPYLEHVVLDENKSVSARLKVRGDLKEVVINARAPNRDNILSPQMGVEKLDMSQINNVPVLLGERDILKTLSLLPGVKAARAMRVVLRRMINWLEQCNYN